jgi:hypothetical protein
MLPLVRKAAEGVVFALSCKLACPGVVGAPPLEIFDDRQPDGTDGFTLLAVLQSKQLASVSASVHFNSIISLTGLTSRARAP